MSRSPKPGGRKDGTTGNGSGGVPSIEMMDKNKDGKLSQDEVPERMAQRVERIETNGDGFNLRVSSVVDNLIFRYSGCLYRPSTYPK